MPSVHRARSTILARRASLSVSFPVLFLAAGALTGDVLAPRSADAQRPTPKPAEAAAPQRTAAHAVDVRWYPWIGCWQRTTDVGPGLLTCVVPAEGASAVDVITVVNGTVDSRERLVVDGRPHPVEKDGCSGSQTAAWATSGARVYIGSAYTCGAELHGRSSTLYAILPTGEWIDAREVESGGGRVLTVTRYRDAGLPSTVPASIRSAIARHSLAATTARASAGAPVSQTAVAEALRAVDSAVVQAWITARAQGYTANTTVTQAPATAGMVRVYEGTPPAAAAPVLEAQPTGRIPTCDSSGCYVDNPYSGYNGMSYVPYPPYPTMWTGSYYYPYPYVAPVVIIRGGTHFDGRHPIGGRPPVIHMLPGHAPAGPSGIHPVQPRQPGGRIPGRVRP